MTRQTDTQNNYTIVISPQMVVSPTLRLILLAIETINFFDLETLQCQGEQHYFIELCFMCD